MTVLRFLTAGESHGPTLTGIIEGMPAGLELAEEYINRELARRQQGYGRGGRMAIETDQVRILSGVRWGKTLGSPITLQIANRDWENWQVEMAIGLPDEEVDVDLVSRPRPGHGDLAGMLKYRTRDARNILERASARETAMRVAIGAVARRLLEHFGMEIISHVIQIGEIRAQRFPKDAKEIRAQAEASPLRCSDPEAARLMANEIDAARAQGDSLGGIFEVIVLYVPAGLGSHVHWDRRLDGRIAQGVMSIPAIKAVEIGLGKDCAVLPGSKVHDEIYYDASHGGRSSFLWRGKRWCTSGGFSRKTNRAGGIEAGMTNGAPLVVRAAMKPIPTLYRPLMSVDVLELEPSFAGIERSDICAVPAAAVVGEAVTAWTLAEACLEKFPGDSLLEMETAYQEHLESLVP